MGALGDTRGTLSSLNPSATFNLQPGSGEEYIIHNIYTSGTIDILMTSSAAKLTIETTSTNLTGYFIHVTNTQYIQMINKESGTIIVGYDGIETK